jgi:pilus assembly protein CpaE
MTVVRFPHVVIAGARERDIEAMLTASGMRSSNMALADLATLAHPSAQPPQVLLVDLRDTRSVPPALAAIKRQHPAIGIVITCSSLDPSLMLEAMRAGVSECVAEPLAQAELQAAIARLSDTSEAPPVGQVFAVIGAKGGVGATTVAVNVATELALLAPEETLLIDLHVPAGDAAIYLGVEPRFTIMDALENTHRLDEAFFRGLVTHCEGGLHLLAAGDRTPTGAGTDRSRALIEFVARFYRYVVVDVPRSDADAMDSLDGISRIMVVANHELPTLKSACRILPALRQRYGKDRVDTVVSRVDRQAEISHQDIEKVIGTPIRHTVPNDYRTALRSLNKGRPIALENHSTLASAFKRIAGDLAGVAGASSKETGRSLFGFIGRR